jgi:hypothetical protein
MFYVSVEKLVIESFMGLSSCSVIVTVTNILELEA